MRSLASAVSSFVLIAALVGCGLPRPVSAVREGRIRVGTPMSGVITEAGPPDLVLASRGAETFFYRIDQQAVVVTFVDGKLVAMSDAGVWPESAWLATDAASDPVSTGRIHVGMTEKEVLHVMGEADGLTAKDGLETLHWTTGDEVDSVVHLRGGKVVGFWDRPVTEFDQNVPTADRDVGTTTGKLRVNMTQADVERLLGKPDGVQVRGDVTTHKYDSNPVFGDHILYGVDYRDGRVVSLHEFNVTRDEDAKDAAEAKREAELAAARQAEAERAMASVLSNLAVAAALGAMSQGGGTSTSQTTVQSTDQRSLEINGTRYEGSGPSFGRSCSLENPCPDGYKCHLVTSNAGSCVQ